MKEIFTRIFLFSAFTFISSPTFSQDFVNNGDVISNLNGNIIYVNGSITNQANGTFTNTGLIYLTGDWTNNAGNPAFVNAGGTVLMTGGNQNIQGTSVTQFYNLTLQGTGVKFQNGIDAITRNILSLNDRELATDINTMFVTNQSLGAITRTSGFVSSLANGALVRSTSLVGDYLFPVGSSIPPARYRPVVLKPNSTSDNAYAVRFANTDATLEGFDISIKDPNVQIVNPAYYHRIRRDSGMAAADITIYFDIAQDGYFSSIAHWQNVPQWENIFATTGPNNYGLVSLTKPSWNDFSTPAFALIREECGELFVPTAFSPNNDGQNDLECVYGKCIKTLQFVIYDRWGEKVFETNDPLECWDGTYRGKPMNTAVFVYYLNANLYDGQTVIKKGNIGLVR